ncbi:MAG: SDR family oxidoreductase [Bacteroidales bacterium]
MADLRKEKEILKGEASRDRTYYSKHRYASEEEARQAFQRSVSKLFDVNQWSNLPGISSTFQLFDKQGIQKQADHPEIHDYIRILLPAPLPENWVVIHNIREHDDRAEFTVSPAVSPLAKAEQQEEISHFFVKEATSTFRVERKGMGLYAYEIGRNEAINNEGKSAGERRLINTLVAEGGWAAFQKFQWEKLTDYLVHNTESSEKSTFMKNLMNYTKSNKGVAVITGASAGVGRACARAFARKGYDVALIARGREALEVAKSEVEAIGQRAIYIQADVADAQALDEAAETTERELGPISVWVNNAMTSVFSPVKLMEPAEYKRVTEVTYLGQVNGALAALKRMLPRNKGSIVFVGSALGYRGIPLQSAYCGSKHAIEGFFDSLRTELMHDKSKVQVSIVELPALNTPQFDFVKSRLAKKARPMGTIYQPEVAAEAIVYAAEHNVRDIKVGLSTIVAINGNKIAPWYADRVLAKDGYQGQQTNEPEDPDKPHNLWAALPGDHGAHGNFDDEARSFSMQFWLYKNRFFLSGAALALTGWLLMKPCCKKQ